MNKNKSILQQKKDELRKRALATGVFTPESEDDHRKRELKEQGRIILSALTGCTCDKPQVRCPLHDTAFEEGEL